MVLRRIPAEGRGKRCSARISLSHQLKVGYRRSSRAPAERPATASSTSCTPPSTTTTPAGPTAGRSAHSLLSSRTAAGRAYKTSVPSTCATISKPPRPTAFRPPPSSSTWPPSACSSITWSPEPCSSTTPALSVKAPRQKLGKGKTPVLTAEEAGELLRSIENDTVIGLRDRALIGVMVFTFARISAACSLNVTDIFHQQRRLWVRLHERGGKFHEMPCHHTREGYLAEYIERARLAEAGRVPLFQATKHRAYGRGSAELTGYGSIGSPPGRWCGGAPRPPVSPPRCATTPSAAPASPPTSRTAARLRRRA